MEAIFYILVGIFIGGTLSMKCDNSKDFVYEHSCLTVSMCKAGKAIHYICRHGEAIDINDHHKCKPIHTVASPCNRIENCKGRKDQSYADMPEHCTSYYTCYRGVFAGRNFCPATLVFNEVDQICDYPDNVGSVCQ